MALPAHLMSQPLIQFCNHFSQTIGFLGRVINSSQGRYLNTEYTHTQTSLLRVRFEPSVQASENSTCLRPGGYCDRHLCWNTVRLTPIYCRAKVCRGILYYFTWATKSRRRAASISYPEASQEPTYGKITVRNSYTNYSYRHFLFVRSVSLQAVTHMVQTLLSNLYERVFLCVIYEKI
jgi:hypothetical protein